MAVPRSGTAIRHFPGLRGRTSRASRLRGKNGLGNVDIPIRKAEVSDSKAGWAYFRFLDRVFESSCLSSVPKWRSDEAAERIHRFAGIGFLRELRASCEKGLEVFFKSYAPRGKTTPSCAAGTDPPPAQPRRSDTASSRPAHARTSRSANSNPRPCTPR